MEEKLNSIKEAITKPMNDMNIIVDSVVFEKEGTVNFLRITLDKVNGIDLDTIVEATNIINPIIDEFDFIDDSFILDISSRERGE